MDPRSKAEFDLEMAKFRKAIGQEPDPDLLMVHRLQAYYGGGNHSEHRPGDRPVHHGSAQLPHTLGHVAGRSPRHHGDAGLFPRTVPLGPSQGDVLRTAP